MTTIPRSFYDHDTVDVARKLLGKILVRQIRGKIISGIIVETEAYGYKDDAASHTYRGMTRRNRAMF
ncbi:MAG: DNA-3-methyladenine glycosylase, partial [Thaumarchaeota archaeon]|nr:DNA-3-methyladenine glycosylase [Nitrososphaerota archaeon]